MFQFALFLAALALIFFVQVKLKKEWLASLIAGTYFLGMGVVMAIGNHLEPFPFIAAFFFYIFGIWKYFRQKGVNGHIKRS
jgi:hypothetical protein